MKSKLLQLILLLSYTTLFSYEITIDSPSKISKEKVLQKHVFKRDDAKEIVIDTDSKLVWQDDVSAKIVKKGLMQAKNYCYKLIHANFTNWRLPSIEELETIADITLSSPAINKNFKNVKSDFYISASPRLSDIDTILYMDFKGGHRYEASRKGRGYVRCVRVDKKKSTNPFKVK